VGTVFVSGKRGRGKEFVFEFLHAFMREVFDSKAFNAIYVNLNPCHIASSLSNLVDAEAEVFGIDWTLSLRQIIGLKII
jgi:hypothetical protein